MMINEVKSLESDPIEQFPILPLSVYKNRILAVRKKMKKKNLDQLVIYSDREHSSNQEYLVGVGPRFEESILIMDSFDSLKIIVGNECQYFLPSPELEVLVELFQDFSPLGQPRDKSSALTKIFRNAGLASGQKIGCIGWKQYSNHLVSDSINALDVPSYIVDELRIIVGNSGDVTNAVDIFINPNTGLRISSDVHQIAQFEYASQVVAGSVRNTISHFSVGKSERSLEKYLVSMGLTLSCHRMISFGDKVKQGLSSPSDNLCKMGVPFTLAIGVAGALTARAGMVAYDERNLEGDLRRFYPSFAANYFSSIVSWYESIKVGATGDSVYQSVDSAIDRNLFKLMLNPGHNLHLEEWSQSIFEKHNMNTIQSGMTLQSDLIPISIGPFCYSNAEDGVVIADVSLQNEIQMNYPEMWERIVRRRDYMRNSIGINLDQSVLPLNNYCAVYSPYALSPDKIYLNSD
jgi:hypothetical protein